MKQLKCPMELNDHILMEFKIRAQEHHLEKKNTAISKLHI